MVKKKKKKKVREEFRNRDGWLCDSRVVFSRGRISGKCNSFSAFFLRSSLPSKKKKKNFRECRPRRSARLGRYLQAQLRSFLGRVNSRQRRERVRKASKYKFQLGKSFKNICLGVAGGCITAAAAAGGGFRNRQQWRRAVLFLRGRCTAETAV